MIIDCHAHYTTAPDDLQALRDAQLEDGADVAAAARRLARVSDDQLTASVEEHQLRVMEERGGDVLLFSPKASGMGHHVGDEASAITWARASNDLVGRVASLFPGRVVGVAQLPQTATSSLEPAAEELRRCVVELGFVGCNLNPDPSGGWWTSPPLTDEAWFPLYETMVELDVPAMIHVSTSCNPSVHTLGAHYLNADTTTFMQLLEGDLFARFPLLRFVIPHGGGAVPYHWGRFEGLATRMGKPPLAEHLLRNVHFDTCVYHQAGIDLLLGVVPLDNLVFASEMLGAVRGTNPGTGSGWDDTKRYVDAAGLSGEQQAALYEDNARRVYPRLAAHLSA